MPPSIAAPLSCGELVQGPYQGGMEAMISCPIDAYSVARWLSGGSDLRLSAGPKTRAAIDLALGPRGRAGLMGRLDIIRALPSGKGLGSSTADIAAAVSCLAEVASTDLTLPSLAQVAAAVERTDGSIVPGAVVFDHVRGLVIRRLKPLPFLRVTIMDTGGSVETARSGPGRRYPVWAVKAIAAAFKAAEAGHALGDPERIGWAASRSALVNQRFLAKPELEKVESFAVRKRLFGVCTAHTGTVIGLLHDRSDGEIEVEAEACLDLECLGTFELISGGPCRVALTSSDRSRWGWSSRVSA